jgi:protein-S-isoprenylcysteine O-methyltransferase Ste14
MYLFWAIWTIWLFSEVALNRLMHSKSSDKKNKDQGTLLLIWVMIAVSITLAVLLTTFETFRISITPIVSYVGLAVIILGMIFRFYAIYSLGKFFTVDVTIRKDHKLKDDGLYGIIRHPSYTGSLISFIGFGLSLNNWLSFALITLIMIVSFVRRINIEERALTEQFGDEYKQYMLKTKRLIPLIY